MRALSTLLAALALAACPAAAAAAQESCPNCLHRGFLPCKAHTEVPPEEEQPTPENPIAYCSWAADCPDCGGTFWVDCPRCARGDLTREVEERKRAIQAWLESSSLVRALGRPVPRLDTHRFALVVEVESLPGEDRGKRRVSGHVLAHQLARDVEWVAARVNEHHEITDVDYRTKMRMWLWSSLEAHQAAQQHFQGTITTGDFKLLGRDPVFSVWTEPTNFDTVPKVRALFVHNSAHMLTSNAFRPQWVGDEGGGWLEAGVGHWYEYERFGRTMNYCVEESSGSPNYENGQWRAPVRRRLEREKDPFLPGLLPKRTGQLTAAEHALCWSFYDFLLDAHPGVVRALQIDLKQKKAPRDVLAKHLGTDLFATEAAWREWVAERYPTKGDEPRKRAAADEEGRRKRSKD